MAIDQKAYVEVLLKLYGEQVAHARHHEAMRAQSTNYILVASVALMGLMVADKAFGYDFQELGRTAAAVLVLFLNSFGVLLSRKHTERSQRHAMVANEYRTQISNELEGSGLPLPNNLRQKGIDLSNKEHPILSQYVPLHSLWEVFHVLFIAMTLTVFFLQANAPKG